MFQEGASDDKVNTKSRGAVKKLTEAAYLYICRSKTKQLLTFVPLDFFCRLCFGRFVTREFNNRNKANQKIHLAFGIWAHPKKCGFPPRAPPPPPPPFFFPSPGCFARFLLFATKKQLLATCFRHFCVCVLFLRCPLIKSKTKQNKQTNKKMQVLLLAGAAPNLPGPMQILLHVVHGGRLPINSSWAPL
jgi:hypothetical protein